MVVIRGFAPVAGPNARILILGSMPGRKSLADQQYYAHPRNAFWKIAGELFHFDPSLPYEDRKQALVAAGVALWDVMARCERASSLDSDIVESTIVANDFEGFLGQHAGIRSVFFNGQKAFQSYRRYVEPVLPDSQGKALLQLPSTSPANAGMSIAEKQSAWRRLILPHLSA